MMVGDPTFSGHLTQTDTIGSSLVISQDETAASGQAAWKAVVDAPHVTMTSPQADVDVTRGPYTLNFADRSLSGTYDKPSRVAHFEVELLGNGVASGGVGTAVVTLKDQLKGVTVDLLSAMEQMLQSLGMDAAMKAAEQAALKDAPPGFDPTSATNTMPVPAPDQTDSVHFKLAFDLNLGEDDQKSVAGSDEIGSFDYKVTIKRE